ncbi:MAG: DUF362 domain-containing protein [Desulfobacterales bacterium]|jgi:uncharacterized protein (DUF362 family)
MQGRDLTRREFFGRAARAGIAAAAAAGVAAIFFDPEGPAPRSGAAAESLSYDFAAAELGTRVAVARGMEREKTLDRALAALGGIGAFIAPGDRVLLKVNAAFASPAALGATTHPELVYEMARHCLKAGAASVLVADNPINDPNACFALTGIGDAARRAGASVMIPGPRHFSRISLPGGRLILNWPVFTAALAGVDKVIGLAPVKDHHRSGASLCLKNWYGLLGGRRNLFHQDIHGIITELAQLVRPTLVVLDGTVSMMANGPTGGSVSDLKPTGTLIVSTDPVAADVFGARLLGLSPDALPYIGASAASGAGTADVDRIDVKLL